MTERILPGEPERVAAALAGRRVMVTIDDAPDPALAGTRMGAMIEAVDPAYRPDVAADDGRYVAGRATLRLDSDALGSTTVVVLPRHEDHGFSALSRTPIAVYVARAPEASGETAHADVIAMATLRLG